MQLTENMIVARSKHSDLGAIKRINLWGCELTDISIIRNMTNVEVLALSVNNLTCLKPLENCKKLQELYLRKNNIQDFNELLHLQNLPVLAHLWLAENPCSVNAGANYRANVLRLLPNLKKLDEETVTAEDLELAKKLDLQQVESARSACFMVMNDKAENSGDTKQQLGTSNQSQDGGLIQRRSQTSLGSMQANENPDLISQTTCLPEVCPKPQNNYTADERQSRSPSKSLSSQHSATPEQRTENREPNFTLPVSFTPRSEGEQPSTKEAQYLNRTHSMSQIPQLNLVVQIHQSQSGLEIPLQIPRSVSLQTVNECADHNETQREQHYQQYDFTGEQTARSNYDAGFLEERTHPCKPRRSEGDHYESGAENMSRSSTGRQAHGYQNRMGYEMATQTPRSRYSRGGVSNVCCEDGLHTHRNSARSSSTLTTNSRSNRRHNANILAALLCIVPELDMDSLQVLDHSIQCRMDELSLE